MVSLRKKLVTPIPKPLFCPSTNNINIKLKIRPHRDSTNNNLAPYLEGCHSDYPGSNVAILIVGTPLAGAMTGLGEPSLNLRIRNSDKWRFSYWFRTRDACITRTGTALICVPYSHDYEQWISIGKPLEAMVFNGL